VIGALALLARLLMAGSRGLMRAAQACLRGAERWAGLAR
jgi:hypothetical protein